MVGGWLAIWIASQAMRWRLNCRLGTGRRWLKLLASSLSDGSLLSGSIVAAVAVQDRADPLPKRQRRPYQRQSFETQEDRFRRAYAESDGDHASYVKWRRNERFRQRHGLCRTIRTLRVPKPCHLERLFRTIPHATLNGRELISNIRASLSKIDRAIEEARERIAREV